MSWPAAARSRSLEAFSLHRPVPLATGQNRDKLDFIQIGIDNERRSTVIKQIGSVAIDGDVIRSRVTPQILDSNRYPRTSRCSPQINRHSSRCCQLDEYVHIAGR